MAGVWPGCGRGVAGITIFWPGLGMGINPSPAPEIHGAGNPGRFLNLIIHLYME